MDSLTYYLCLFFLAALPPLLFKLKRRERGNNGLRLPPGPWRLPVIGSLHHLLLGSSRLPHRAMADIAWRLKAPLIYLKLGEVPVVVASSPDAACEIMRTHDVNFATRPWTPTVEALMADGEGLVFARYGPEWRQLRRISILELLSARRVQSFRGAREEEVGRLVAAVAAAAAGEAAAVNLSQRIALLVNDMAVRAMVGDRFERQQEFLELVAEGIEVTAGFGLGDLFPSSRLAQLVGGTARRAKVNRRKMFALMDHTIRQHEERRAPAAAAAEGEGGVVKEDLLDVLLRIQKDGGLDVPLTMGMIKTLILDLFVAGSETSASTLQWAMAELVRNPEAMRRAQAEVREKLAGKTTVNEDDLVDLKHTKLILKETLRLHPVVPLLLPRECREPCEVMGYDVPRGTTVFVNVWAIGRDPRYWGDDAAAFRPERFEAAGKVVDSSSKGTGTERFEYTPFGAGRRVCPGMAFAQASMELALAALLYHFDWTLPGELDMAEEMGITARRKRDLYLHPVVCVPPPPPPPPHA